MESLKAKKKKADEMFTQLVNSINSEFKIETKEFNKKIKKPAFI